MDDIEQADGGYADLDEGPFAGLSRAISESDVVLQQLMSRRRLIEKIEKAEELRTGKKTGVIAFICNDYASIDSDDIPAIGDALLSVGDVENLMLILESPGGDGNTAEKIVSLCRAFGKEFQVVIPNRAKSAATMISLGADSIVMGFCSELGPIDPQIVVRIGGVGHYISAQSFIDAKRKLEAEYRERRAAGEDGTEILQQIASLDQPFIRHCEQLMAFSRDMAEKMLRSYMFSQLPRRDQGKAVTKVLDQLSTVDLFRVHGRMINATAARTELGLEIRILARTDEIWKLVWDYYNRAYVSTVGQRPAKLVESRDRSLMK